MKMKAFWDIAPCSLLADGLVGHIAQEIGAVNTSETWVNFYETTRRDIPEGWHFHSMRMSIQEELKPNGVVEWSTLQLCIREIPGSKLDRETALLSVLWFSSVPPGECRDSTLK
jgi:hypothetical protein